MLYQVGAFHNVKKIITKKQITQKLSIFSFDEQALGRGRSDNDSQPQLTSTIPEVTVDHEDIDVDDEVAKKKRIADIKRKSKTHYRK